MAKTGRPTKYDPKFHPESFIAFSKKGMNLTEIAAEWDVNKDTINEWRNRYPTFSVAIKKGRALCEAWYIGIFKAGMVGKLPKFNVTAGIWLMRNIFGWSDQQVDPDAAKEEYPEPGLRKDGPEKKQT